MLDFNIFVVQSSKMFIAIFVSFYNKLSISYKSSMFDQESLSLTEKLAIPHS